MTILDPFHLFLEDQPEEPPYCPLCGQPITDSSIHGVVLYDQICCVIDEGQQRPTLHAPLWRDDDIKH